MASKSDKKVPGFSFLALGCGPYYREDREYLTRYFLEFLPSRDDLRFAVHLGDLWRFSRLKGVAGNDQAYRELISARTSFLDPDLAGLPVFFVPGDNDWFKPGAQKRAWLLDRWRKYLVPPSALAQVGGLPMEDDVPPPQGVQARSEALLESLDGVKRHTRQPENFAFVAERTLFVGIHHIGGPGGPDFLPPFWNWKQARAPWLERLQTNAAWVGWALSWFKGAFDLVVLFSQTNLTHYPDWIQEDRVRSSWLEPLIAALKRAHCPIRVVHADYHFLHHVKGFRTPARLDGIDFGGIDMAEIQLPMAGRLGPTKTKKGNVYAPFRFEVNRSGTAPELTFEELRWA